ncbi:MAG: Ppx/GppA phosphatase family protein [Pseudomonadota bacterium]
MFATIDIGSNSTLLLIGEVLPDGQIAIKTDLAKINRLGEGVAQTEKLQPIAILRTIEVLKEYRELCNNNEVSQVIAVGTQALRTATNAKEFVSQIKKELGLEIEILSAKNEAWYTYIACAKDFGEDILVCDIGGGSTELIWGNFGNRDKTSEKCHFLSASLGCVALTERLVQTDPISAEDFHLLRVTIDEQLNKSLNTNVYRHAKKLVATAGTATTLASIYKKLTTYDHQKVHGTNIEMLDLQVILDNLKARSVLERAKMPGMQKGREDVLLAGTLILDRIMRRFGYDNVTFSDRGLRWGLFYEHFLPKTSS